MEGNWKQEKGTPQAIDNLHTNEDPVDVLEKSCEELRLKPKHILVTGGAGFIGSNFVRWVLDREPDVQVTNLDLLTYAGNLESLADVDERFGSGGDQRYAFVHGNIRDPALVAEALKGKQDRDMVDTVVHFAAESHVDRSIKNPAVFVETNVAGTLSLLEACRTELETNPREFRFIHLSTDEVYGSLGPDESPFTEASPLAPTNPYSASKAAADHLVRSYVNTYDLPAIVTRCSNNYGPYQFPEKLVPLMVTRAIRDQSLPVYGDGKNMRDWIHVLDHCGALWTILERGEVGAVFNIGGQTEIQNIDIVTNILELLGKPKSLIEFVTDRPGHDKRYSMDISRTRLELGWSPNHGLVAGLRETVEWYLANESWWDRVLNDAYQTTTDVYLQGPKK